MKRFVPALAALVAALVLVTAAWAGSVTYMSSSYWPAGHSGATSFSPSWVRNTMTKASPFDTTITFIDNVSYSWHSTFRSWDTWMATHWFSSQTKKAHCRANMTSGSWAACVAYS